MILCENNTIEYETLKKLTVEEYLLKLDGYAARIEADNQLTSKMKANRNKK